MMVLTGQIEGCHGTALGFPVSPLPLRDSPRQFWQQPSSAGQVILVSLAVNAPEIGFFIASFYEDADDMDQQNGEGA